MPSIINGIKAHNIGSDCARRDAGNDRFNNWCCESITDEASTGNKPHGNLISNLN